MLDEKTASVKPAVAGLQIADLRVHSIAIADPPLRSSYGLHAPYALRTIIELDGGDGIVGLGETHGGEAIARVLESLKPKLAGSAPFTLLSEIATQLGTKRTGTSQDRSQTYLVPGENPLDLEARINSVLEIACLDLIGKSIGKPVCDLLGARARDEVAFSAYAFYKHAGGGGEGDDQRDDLYGESLTPEALVKQVQQMTRDYGFDEIKLKAGVLEPEIEIETIRQLRAAFGPKVPLRLDPNCAWSADTSLEIGKALHSELDNGGYLEDPTATLAGMAEVRRTLLQSGVPTPLASNVAVTSFADLPESVRTDAVQIVLCDPHYWGGIRQVQHVGKVCETFGLGLSMHSNSHLGISLMAMAHAAASTPHLTYACDTHYPWQTAQDEVVEGGRIKFNRGRVRIPDKPGLGVDLDHDQLARGRERFTKCSFRKRDDEAEMRKHVDPNWKRILARW
ncbi:MAG TPA: enolase C-terminal domain-like protein [Candidatus Acidoferrales bacterium]|nr:enolase C-terminal domain-like protein [Candidatus Acidoferrales bacterium]